MMSSTYTLTELLRQWMNEDLTSDQMIGHMLQHLIMLHDQVLQMERCITTAMAGIPVVGAEEGKPKQPAQRRGSG